MKTTQYFSLIAATIFFGCSKSNEVNLPEYVQQLDNLVVISAESDHESLQSFAYQKEIRYRDTETNPIGSISGFTVDNNNRVFIGDASQLVIHVFDSDGDYIGNLGRQGEGPGEFQSLDRMINTSNDVLFVNNAASGNILLFSLEDLGFLQTLPLSGDIWSNTSDELANATPGDFFPAGGQSLIMSFMNRERIVVHEEQIREIEYSRLFFEMDWDGTLQSGLLQHKNDSRQFTFTMGGMMLGGALPFFGNLSAAFNNERLYLGHPEEFLIEVYNTQGNDIESFYYPFDRVKLNRYEIKDLVDDEIMQEVMRHIDLPETWPAFNNLLIDDENRLWLSTIVEDFDIYEWWILEETGELIAKFEWPRDEPIEVVKKGYMYTRETEEDTGLQQIVRYRVEMEES